MKKGDLKMNKRGLVIGLLVMLAVITSGFTYAFWANSVTGNSETVGGSVQIGSGEDVTVEVSIGAQGGSTLLLVPTGFVADVETQDDEIVISFVVTWVDDAALEGIDDADVSVLIDNIKVNDVANPYTLISVVEQAGNPTTISLNGTATFYFVVTMGVPANQTQYDAVAGLGITFDLTFTVTP